MSRSRRFSVAMHVLSLLAIRPEQHFSSELVAKSVGTNSVVVRRVLSLLHKAGMVACQTGAGGGAKLTANPKTLTLLAIYQAVEDCELFSLHDPHPDCPVACTLRTELASTMNRIQDATFVAMSEITLDQLSEPAMRAYEAWQEAKTSEENENST